MSPDPVPTAGLQSIPAAMWEALAASPSRLLMFDCDGTLAPFCPERTAAEIPCHTLELLGVLGWSARTSLAIVSGRPQVELEGMLSGVRAHLIGEHGWVERSREGRLVRWPLPAGISRALQMAARAARESGWAPYLERKRSAIVLHTRSLPRHEARRMEEECHRLWRSFESEGMRLDRIDGGIELRALAHNKGTAVARLLARAKRGTVPVYVGDDETDEDAFREVGAVGFSVRVGDPNHPTAAGLRLASPAEVGAFLEEWTWRLEQGEGAVTSRPGKTSQGFAPESGAEGPA